MRNKTLAALRTFLAHRRPALRDETVLLKALNYLPAWGGLAIRPRRKLAEARRGGNPSSRGFGTAGCERG